MESNLILAINPGSTSTKIAVYDNTKCIFIQNLKHSSDEISGYKNIADQFQFRKDIILQVMSKVNIPIENIKIIVGRGGLVKPIKSGVYRINDAMKRDLKIGVLGQHASNLGGLIADDIAKSIDGAIAFIADPVVVDELEDVARISGHPEFERISIFHALNQKAIARAHAKSLSLNYEDLNLIVVHLGGGISVGAHKKGKVIDVNQALDGEGPFSPERAGTTPTYPLVDMCFSGKYSIDEIPQLYNVINGEMALVGPRPETALYVDQYTSWQRRRLETKPGVTGLAQVNGVRGNIDSVDERVMYDIEYIENQSISLDLKILFATLLVFPFQIKAE